ncbi:MAG: amidohydrolase family protein [Xylophilus ampelinus]
MQVIDTSRTAGKGLAAQSASRCCDTHVHLFMPESFPYALDRGYTPGAADVDALRKVLARTRMSRVVLVQPSCYGTDNAALLHGLSCLGAGARGVAVANLANAGDEVLAQLHRAGVRGLRLNISVRVEDDLKQVRRELAECATRIAPLGWHLQLHAGPAVLKGLADDLGGLSVPLVLDHFGAGYGSAPIVTELLTAGNTWVKLSAPYRLSDMPGYQDLAALAKDFARSKPHRLLWGSDWPHTGGAGVRTTSITDIEPFRAVDAADALQALSDCFDHDESLLDRILIHNPAALYGFAASDLIHFSTDEASA